MTRGNMESQSTGWWPCNRRTSAAGWSAGDGVVQRDVFVGQATHREVFGPLVAGADEPVATRSSVDILTGRIDSLERQITTLIRNNEEAQYRLGQMETELARLRANQETAAASAAAAPPPMEEPEEVDVPDQLISTPRY